MFERVRATGDRAARDELVRRYLPLARKLAARYTSKPYEQFDDLLQVACIGLLGAVDRFDPARGVGFSSFALPTMLGEPKRYFRGAGWAAHVPRRAQELALRVDNGPQQITARTGRAPRVQQIAQYLELSTEDVLTGLEAKGAHYAISLEAPSLSAAVRSLPYMEREALRLRVQEDLKQTEIADRLCCSQMQVSRLLRRAAVRITELIEPDLISGNLDGLPD